MNFTPEDHEMLVETHTKVEMLCKFLLDNGQPGEINKIRKRLTWLERIAYTGVGALGTLKAIAMWKSWKF